METFAEWKARQAGATPTTEAPTTYGADALKDRYFLSTLRSFYRARGKEFSDDQELIDHARRDQIWKNWNSVGMAVDTIDAMNDDAETRRQKARIKQVFDDAPFDYSDIPTYLGSIALDPLNLIGGAGGTKAGVEALQAGKGILPAMGAAAKAGFKSEALAGGVVGAGTNFLQQKRDQELGLRDETSLLEAGASGVANAAISGTAGSLFGIAGTAASTPAVRKLVSELERLGYPQERIAALPHDEAKAIVQEQKAYVPPAPETTAADVAGAAEPNTESLGPPKPVMPGVDTKDFETSLGQLDLIARQWQDKLVQAKLDGAEQADGIPELRQALNTLSQFQDLPARIEAAREDVAKLFQANDVNRAERDRRINDLNDIILEFKATLADPRPERFIELAQKQREQLEAMQAANDAAKEAAKAAKKAGKSQANPDPAVAAADETTTDMRAQTSVASPQPTNSVKEPNISPDDLIARLGPLSNETERVARVIVNSGKVSRNAIATETGLTPKQINGALNDLSGRLVQPVEGKKGTWTLLPGTPVAEQADAIKASKRAKRAQAKASAETQAAGVMEIDGEDAKVGDELWGKLTSAAAANDVDMAEAVKDPDFLAALESLVRAQSGDKAETIWNYVQMRHLAGDAKRPARESKAMLNSLAAHIRRVSPGISQEDAYTLAEAQLQALEAKVAKNSAPDAPTAMPTTAGRGADGKVQGILKKGMVTGSDDGRTITDGKMTKVPRKLRGDTFDQVADPKLRARLNRIRNTVLPDLRSAREYAGRQRYYTKEGDLIADNPDFKGNMTLGPPSSMPVAYTARKGQPLVDGGKARHGQIVYFDPTRNVSFSSLEAARPGLLSNNARAYNELNEAVRALRKGEQPKAASAAAPNAKATGQARKDPTREDLILGRQAEKMEAAADAPNPKLEAFKQAILNAAKNKTSIEDELNNAFAAFKAKAAVGSTAGEIATPPAQSPQPPAPTREGVPVLPVRDADGNLLAIRRKSDPSDVRVISAAQAGGGKNISDLLGSRGNWDEWEAGYAKGTSGTRAAEDSFKPADLDNLPEAAPVEEVAVADIFKPDRAAPVIDGEQARQTSEVNEDAKSSGLAILRRLRSDEKSALGDKRTINDRVAELMSTLQRGDLNLWDLHRQIANLEASMPLTADGASWHMAMADLHDWKAKHFPGRVRYSLSDLAEAKATFADVLTGLNKDDYSFIGDVLDRLAAHDVGMPILRKAPEGETSGLVLSKAGGAVIDLTSDGIAPRPVIALHEFGHWAYTHVLSDDQKAAFHRIIADKYATGEGLKLAESRASGLLDNEVASGDELFASQFAMHAMQKLAPASEREQTFWAKAAALLKNVLKFFFDPKNVDSDFKPFFEHILNPQNPDLIPSQIVSPTGETDLVWKSYKANQVFKYASELNDARNNLANAFGEDSLRDIVQYAHDVRSALYKIEMYQSGRFLKQGERPDGRFGIFKRNKRDIIKLRKQLDEALDEYISDTGEFTRRPDEDVIDRIENMTVTSGGQSRDLIRTLDRFVDEGLTYLGGFREEDIRAIRNDDGALELVALTPGQKQQRAIAARAKAARKREAASNQAKANSASDVKRPARERKSEWVPEPVAIRTAHPDLLAQEANKWRDTDYGAQLQAEIRRRERAKPLDPNATRKVITTSHVLSALEKEDLEYRGLTSEDGVAPGAPIEVRDMQSRLTHRDPEIQEVMRSLHYRLDAMGLLPEGDRASEAWFSRHRTEMRTLAKNLVRHINDPDTGVKNLVYWAMQGEKPMSFVRMADVIAPDLQGVPQLDIRNAIAGYLRGEDLKVTDPLIRKWIGEVQDRVSYLASGNIADRETKARHPGVDNYGDVFERPNNTQLVDRADPNKHYDLASPERRQAIEGFTKGGLGWNGKSPVVFWHRVDLNDPDVPTYGVAEPKLRTIGSLVHATRANADEHLNRSIAEMAYDAAKTDAEREDVLNISAELSAAQSDSELLRRQIDVAIDNGEDASDLIERAETTDAYVQELMVDLQQMAAMGPDLDSQPVYVSLKKPLFLSGASRSANAETIRNLVDDMVAHNVPMSGKAQRIYENAEKVHPLSAVYDLLVPRRKGGEYTRDQESALVTARLQDLGYDGVVFEGHTPADTTYSVFDPTQIKRVDATSFDDSIYLVGQPDARPYFGTDDVEDDWVKRPARERAVDTISRMEEAGLPKALSEPLLKIAKGRHLNERDGKVIWNATRLDRAFAPNSERLRKAGLTSYADWISPENGTGHFERVASETARVVDPLARQMAALPDVPRHLKGWINQTKNLLPFVEHQQPGSHSRIVKALRRPAGSDAEKALTPQEREVYDLTRKSFKSMIDKLRANGVMTSEIVGPYFPQVWSKDKIALNEDAFRAGLTNYFLREDRREGRTRTAAQVKELANHIVENLLNDDGVFIPPPGSGSSDLIGDHLDYQRMIRLEQDPQALKELEPFLEDNLGAITTRYMNHATRRLDITQKWGTAGHAYHDYMNVLSASVNGDPDFEAAKLLVSNKVFRKSIYTTTDEGERVLLEFRNEVPMPFQNDPEGAMEAIDHMKTLIPQGPKAMANFLLSVAPEPTAKSNAFQRRAEAIANAIYELNTSEVALHSDSITHADQMFRAILHKPVDSSAPANSLLGRSTRFLRNFNAVTLLSFTLLSSFGDITMPLMRSGSMKAAVDGWRRLMFDKEYRQMMKNVGVNIETMVHEHMIDLFGSDSSKFTTAFFNATGLTPWTRLMRESSGMIGYEWFKAEFRRASNFGPDSPEYKKAFRHLRQYGLEGLLRDGVSIDSPDAMSRYPELRQAIIKFANGTIFEPNKNDIPVAWQTPVGQLITQLKSFPLMMMRLSKHAFNEAGFGRDGVKEGKDFGPLLMMFGVAPVVGAGAMSIKDLVQARGEDNTHSIKKRLGTDEPILGQMLQAAGVPKDDPGAVNAFIGWYVQSLFFLGGFGLIGDILHDTSANLDNGAYGAQRVAGTVFGPSVGDFVSAFNVAAGGMQAFNNALTDEEKNAAIRSGAREIVGRVPVVGGIKSVREGIVDAVAGPSGQGTEE